jgi:cytidine deaminase
MTPSPEVLLESARNARRNAYAPYSKFEVGAAIEVEGGAIVVGSNIENASFGLSLCAERAAVGAAISAGHRELRTIAIAGPAGVTTPPCGACRQVLAEFNPQMAVVYTSPSGVVTTTLAELFPHSFRTSI